MYAGVGSGGRFRKVPKGWFRRVLESSGACWYRFGRMSMLLLLGIPPKLIFIPQQRKLMGSSAQTSSGVRWCGSQEQVPEGSGEFRRMLV